MVASVAPGALPLEDCFGTASGSQGCVLSRLVKLAERRRRKVGGDAWIVCDGPLEACWTEALAASISSLTAKAVAAELAGSSKVAVRILIETDQLGHASPATRGPVDQSRSIFARPLYWSRRAPPPRPWPSDY